MSFQREEGRPLDDKGSENPDAVLMKPNLSYSREFLLSLSVLGSGKKLPSGFDESLISGSEAALVRIPNRKRIQSSLLLQGFIQNDYGASPSTRCGRSLDDKSSENPDAIIMKPKLSYSRDFLLSLSDLGSGKELPSGFDEPLISEFGAALITIPNRKTLQSRLPLQGFIQNDYGASPSTRVLRSLDDKGSKNTDAILMKPKLSYWRELLFSLSDLGSGKKLPNGFDESLISESEAVLKRIPNQKKIQTSLPLQRFRQHEYSVSPSTRGLRSLDDKGFENPNSILMKPNLSYSRGFLLSLSDLGSGEKFPSGFDESLISEFGAALVRIPNRKTHQSRLPLQGFIQNDYGASPSTRCGRSLDDKGSENHDAILMKPKLSYSREFLLSLSDLGSGKKLPSGFDESLISESEAALISIPNRKKNQSSLPFQHFRQKEYSISPSTRGVRSFDDKDSEKHSAILMKAKLSYSREFLLSISDLGSGKKLPSGFDESLISGSEAALVRIPNRKRIQSSLLLQGFIQNDYGASPSTRCGRSLDDKSSENPDAILMKPKLSYSRDFLLSLSDLGSGKKLSSGFDESLISESEAALIRIPNQKKIQSSLPLQRFRQHEYSVSPSTRGVRSLDDKGSENPNSILMKAKLSHSREFLLSLSDLGSGKKLPSGFDESLISEFEDALIRNPNGKRIQGNLPLQGFSRNDFSASPPTRVDAGIYSRGIYGKWESRLSDWDSDYLADNYSDSGRCFGPQCRQPWQTPEHDRLLESGSFPRPSGFAAGVSALNLLPNVPNQLHWTNEPYHPSSTPLQGSNSFKKRHILHQR